MPPETPRPALMGIVNCTPDSFSDGGLFATPRAAIDHGLRLWEQGAAWIDVGGESTRPGASPVSVDEELRRVLPVVEGLVAEGVRVSVDTRKAAVAAEALARGAAMINDVSSGADPAMFETCARYDCKVVLMHMRGEPRTMQDNPSYEDVVGEVRSFLLDRVERAASRGIDRSRLLIDPGIGFGKLLEHNLALIKNISAFVDTGIPVVLGASRKSFLGRILERDGLSGEIGERALGTEVVHVWAALHGVSLLRVHDVLAARRALATLFAITEAS